jgi:hypothetical protein
MNDDLTDKQLNTILDELLRMGRERLSIVRDPLLKAVELAQNARITKELFLEEVKNIWESRNCWSPRWLQSACCTPWCGSLGANHSDHPATGLVEI